MEYHAARYLVSATPKKKTEVELAPEVVELVEQSVSTVAVRSTKP